MHGGLSVATSAYFEDSLFPVGTPGATSAVIFELSSEHAAAVEVISHGAQHIGSFHDDAAIFKLLNNVILTVFVALVVVEHVRVHSLRALYRFTYLFATK